LLCISQEENTAPFPLGGVKIYALEEALFHTFHHWKEAAEEFCGAGFIEWVDETLHLPSCAAKIREIAGLSSFQEKLLAFCRLLPYFEEKDLLKLKAEATAWEKRLEWEKWKEQGDFFLRQGYPEKSLVFYRKAIEKEPRADLFNNMAVALTQLRRYPEAVERFRQALDLRPDHPRLLMNYAEAAIFAKDLEAAKQTLETLAQFHSHRFYPDAAEMNRLYGELSWASHQFTAAEGYFKKALELKPDPDCFYRLSDLYTALKRFDSALDVIRHVHPKDPAYWLKRAEIMAASGQPREAVAAIESALISYPHEIKLWIRLAEYCRLNHDLTRAAPAALQALSIDPANPAARFENARVKKALGKTREYQAELRQLLASLKDAYRESDAAEV
jgi:tetratricopeptide (TPR) repeat protein